MTKQEAVCRYWQDTLDDVLVVWYDHSLLGGVASTNTAEARLPAAEWTPEA